MNTKVFTGCFIVLLLLMYACTSKETQRKKRVQEYYDAYYQKRDINAVKSLFVGNIEYYDENNLMAPDTFALIFNFDKKLNAKAQISNITMNKDTVTVLEKTTDDLDPLLNRPDARYIKKFVFKGNKLIRVINIIHKPEEWATDYIDRIRLFLMWIQKNYPHEYNKLSKQPYTNAELLLSYAKEYAKQNKP